jgi:hypothetical protein
MQWGGHLKYENQRLVAASLTFLPAIYIAKTMWWPPVIPPSRADPKASTT